MYTYTRQSSPLLLFVPPEKTILPFVKQIKNKTPIFWFITRKGIYIECFF